MNHRFAIAARADRAHPGGLRCRPRRPRASAPLMVVGNDEKQSWNDAGAVVIARPAATRSR